MVEVPLNHLMDTELGPPVEGEPQIAPFRSYELLWRKLFVKYPEDCMEIERAYKAAPRRRH